MTYRFDVRFDRAGELVVTTIRVLDSSGADAIGRPVVQLGAQPHTVGGALLAGLPMYPALTGVHQPSTSDREDRSWESC